jgi:hypothetical protein
MAFLASTWIFCFEAVSSSAFTPVPGFSADTSGSLFNLYQTSLYFLPDWLRRLGTPSGDRADSGVRGGKTNTQQNMLWRSSELRKESPRLPPDRGFTP